MYGTAVSADEVPGAQARRSASGIFRAYGLGSGVLALIGFRSFPDPIPVSNNYGAYQGLYMFG